MSTDEAAGEHPELKERLAALGREPVAVPPDLARAVLRRVQALRAPRGTLALEGVRGGDTLVAERAVVRVAGAAARRVEGVVFASVTLDEEGRAAVRLVADLGPDLQRIATDVRAAVAGEVARLCGLGLVRVDVRVEDVTD